MDNDFLVSSFTMVVVVVVVADGESSASSAGEAKVSPLMRGCLIVVVSSSSSSCNEDEPSSMSRSCSIRGDIFLHIVVTIVAIFMASVAERANFRVCCGYVRCGTVVTETF